jgi:hypothetical protein
MGPGAYARASILRRFAPYLRQVFAAIPSIRHLKFSGSLREVWDLR